MGLFIKEATISRFWARAALFKHWLGSAAVMIFLIFPDSLTQLQIIKVFRITRRIQNFDSADDFKILGNGVAISPAESRKELQPAHASHCNDVIDACGKILRDRMSLGHVADAGGGTTVSSRRVSEDMNGA